jgi:hypothetical protein
MGIHPAFLPQVADRKGVRTCNANGIIETASLCRSHIAGKARIADREVRSIDEIRMRIFAY